MRIEIAVLAICLVVATQSQQQPPVQQQPVNPQLVHPPPQQQYQQQYQQQQPPPQYQQQPPPPPQQAQAPPPPQQAPPPPPPQQPQAPQQPPPPQQAPLPPQQQQQQPPAPAQQQPPPPPIQQQQPPPPVQQQQPPPPHVQQQQQPPPVHQQQVVHQQQAVHHQHHQPAPPGYQYPPQHPPPNIPMPPPQGFQQQQQQYPPSYHQQGAPPPHMGGQHPGYAQPAVNAQPALNAQFVDVHHQGHAQGPPLSPHAGGPLPEYELSDEEYRRLQQNEKVFDDPSAKTNTSDSESLAAEWERIMTDFMPDMIVTFRLSSGESEHFHQDVTAAPTLIRGGFFESTDDNAASISFQIVSPSGKIAYQSSKGEGLFKITTTEQGTYTFAVNNGHWSGQKYVTFVVGAGQEKGLTKDDISTLDGNVRVLYRMLGDMETQSSYLWLRQKSHLEDINKTANQTYYALIVELLCTGLATMLQLSVIKKMVSHRRMF